MALVIPVRVGVLFQSVRRLGQGLPLGSPCARIQLGRDDAGDAGAVVNCIGEPLATVGDGVGLLLIAVRAREKVPADRRHFRGLRGGERAQVVPVEAAVLKALGACRVG